MADVEVRVDASDLFQIAARYRQAGRTDLVRQLDRGSREAGQVIEQEIRSSTDTYIPQGFESRFKQNLETKTEVRLARDRRITVRVGGRGKSGNRRHIRQMNAGDLRHPVYGRRRRLKAGGRYVPDAHRSRVEGGYYVNPWHGQRIRPGLVDEPAERAMPRAVAKIQAAMDRTVANLGRAG